MLAADFTIDTWSGPRAVHAILANEEVGSVTVEAGEYTFDADKLPINFPADGEVVNKTITIGDNNYDVTCLLMGNLHTVIFADRVDSLDIDKIGPEIEFSPLFPDRTNVEFIRIVNDRTIKMRVWERGAGETLACGTGACAAAVAAVKNGFCQMGKDITVKVRGGDLTVCVYEDNVTLTGNAVLSFEGTKKI